MRDKLITARINVKHLASLLRYYQEANPDKIMTLSGVVSQVFSDLYEQTPDRFTSDEEADRYLTPYSNRTRRATNPGVTLPEARPERHDEALRELFENETPD